MPSYLYELILKSNPNYSTQNFDHIDPYYCRTDIFKYSFFPYTILEWNKLDANLKIAKSYMCFRNSLLKIGRPVQNSIFKVFNTLGIKFLTRLRLSLSLNENNFKYNFQNCLNPLCSCSLEVESTIHFFLHCHFFWQILRNPLRNCWKDYWRMIIQGWFTNKAINVWKPKLQLWRQ